MNTVEQINVVQMSYDENDYRVNVGIYDVDMVVAAGFSVRADAETYALGLSRAFAAAQGGRGVPIVQANSDGGPIR